MACYHPITLDISLGEKGHIHGGDFVEYKRIHDSLNNPPWRRIVRVGCGSCIGCRLDRALEWTTKASIEMEMQPDDAFFVTLTYSDLYLPYSRVVDPRDLSLQMMPVLRRSDVQNFIKRLRSELDRSGRGKIRIMYCGEYGPSTQRAHYHLLIWNLQLNDLRRPTLEESKGKLVPPGIYTSDELNALWGQGFIEVMKMCAGNVAYVCRYTLKKQLGAERAEYLKKCTLAEMLEFVDKETGEVGDVTGRNIRPFEFVGASNRPGIGMAAIEDPQMRDRMLDEGSVSIVLGGKVMKRPIPRTWLDHLGEAYPGKVAQIRAQQLRRAEEKMEAMAAHDDRSLEEILACAEAEKLEKMCKYDREL